MSSEFFNKMQYGKESPKGTAVACTDMWIGQMPPVKTDRKPTYPVEHFGVRSEAFRSVIHSYLYNNTFTVEHGAFQHLLLPFGIGLKGGVTAAEQTVAQSDFLWDFTPSMTAANNPDAVTLRFGDDTQAWMTAYAMCERIRISGQVAQGAEASPVSVEWDFFGRELLTTTFTAGLTIPTLEPMNAKLAQLYLNDSWAAVGTTELANLLRTFDIEILSGVHPKFEGSTEKTFNGHSEGIISVMGTFGIEAGASANAILASQQAGNFKVASLVLNGGTIGTGDAHNFTLNFGGTFEDASAISGADRGDNLATFVLHNYYDKGAGKKIEAKVTTNSDTY